VYGGRLRVRAAGILIEDDSVLLIQLHSPVSDSLVWVPPGGGVEFGESLAAAVQREFKEETALEVDVCEQVHFNELIAPPYHALEFFFKVEYLKGEPILGYDPEQNENDQLLKQLRKVPLDQISDYDIRPVSLKKLLATLQ
jgi:8-oxo-dGTP diphosphatase